MAFQGLSPPSISPDGRFIAVEARNDPRTGSRLAHASVFVIDRENGSADCVSIGPNEAPADGDSTWPSASEDGMIVAFQSEATNLVAGDTNKVVDVFVHDRRSKKTKRISVDSRGRQANGPSGEPSIDRRGEAVAFSSSASNLDAGLDRSQSVFLHDLSQGTTVLVSARIDGGDGPGRTPAISGNGQWVAYCDYWRVLVWDRASGSVKAILGDAPLSAARGGQTAGISISGDGRFVAFSSDARGLVPDDSAGQFAVYVFDRHSGRLESIGDPEVVQSDRACSMPSVSDDGRFVAFRAWPRTSGGSNKAVEAVCVFDRETRVTRVASVDGNGRTDHGTRPRMAGDGETLVYIGDRGMVEARERR